MDRDEANSLFEALTSGGLNDAQAAVHALRQGGAPTEAVQDALLLRLSAQLERIERALRMAA